MTLHVSVTYIKLHELWVYYFEWGFFKQSICYKGNASPSGKRKTVLLQWHVFVIWDDILFQSLDFVYVIIIVKKPDLYYSELQASTVQ